MTIVQTRTVARVAVTLAAALALSACGDGGAKQKGGRGQQGPVQVGYVVVQPTTSAATTELAARTSAYQSSEVRPQVNGIIRKRLFTEGSLVRKGQTLYQIDPSLYVASTNQAQANLLSAQANAQATKIKADRYKPLAQAQAVAQQDYTDAAAVARQAAAAVSQNKAALETARINLHFTRVPAPISGRIGRSLFTEGALVTASQTDPLATIQRLDPIYVDMQQSSSDLLALRKALASGGATPASANVKLKLEDGSDYGYSGHVEFSEVVVDPSTGTVTLRARFPNPQGLLLPGMFVRAQFETQIDQNVFLVPQQAVTRDPRGTASVLVVGPGDKIVVREIVAPRTQGAFWVVSKGLNAGDKVVIQGTSKAKPGMAVKAVPANTPENVSVPAKGKDKQAPQQNKAG